MTDPHTTPLAPQEGADADPGRDTRIDDLLLVGLDHYFAGRFQDAIDVWGRVLFLDRSQARARAYIDRARGALAERQRKSEELVQEGVAALQRGDDGIARQLLSAAVEQGDSPETAHAYLDRLEHASIERAEQVRASRARRLEATRQATPARSMLTSSNRPIRALPIIGLALLAAVVILFATAKDPLKPFVDFRRPPPVSQGAALRSVEPLPVPRAAELALSRARAMFAAGQLRPALSALDDVPGADPLSVEADRLRASIQRALLGLPQLSTNADNGTAQASAPTERRQ